MDVVRPGRFMETLHAMRAELQSQLAVAAAGGAVDAHNGGAPPSPANHQPLLGLLMQLDDIGAEALFVLDGMQRSSSSSSIGSAGAVEVEDYKLPSSD
jgi:hypothetical protein